MINNFVIFGDSYSTHSDFIPKGYLSYYYNEIEESDNPVKKMNPEETWWGRLIENEGAKLVLNDSWSGSTIGYTGYAGDCSTTSSFICRFRQLLNSGFFGDNKIDTVFVFGGTNDSWSNAPLGEMKFSDWKEEELFSVLPAITYFTKILRDTLPDAHIVVIANCGIKDEIIECLRSSAERIGADFAELKDIEKKPDHPTVLGMEQIYRQVITKIKRGNM